MPMEDASSRLRRLRKAAELTQAQLAVSAGVSQGTIGNIESGIRGYGESLVDIARALDVTPDYLRCVEKGGTSTSRSTTSGPKASARRPKAPDASFGLRQINLLKVAELGRDDRLRLEGAWLDAAARLGIDVVADEPGKPVSGELSNRPKVMSKQRRAA